MRAFVTISQSLFHDAKRLFHGFSRVKENAIVGWNVILMAWSENNLCFDIPNIRTLWSILDAAAKVVRKFHGFIGEHAEPPTNQIGRAHV